MHTHSAVPAGIAALPRAHDAAIHAARAFARALRLPANFAPEAFHSALAGMILLSEARVLIAATRLPAPLLVRECLDIAEHVDCDLLLLRQRLPGEWRLDVLASEYEGGKRRTYEGYTFIPGWTFGGVLMPAGPHQCSWQIDRAGITAVPTVPREVFNACTGHGPGLGFAN